MKGSRLLTKIALLAVLITGVCTTGFASQYGYIPSIEIEFLEDATLVKSGPSTINYTLKIPGTSKEWAGKTATVDLTVYYAKRVEIEDRQNAKNFIDTVETRSWEIQFDDNNFYAGSYQITLPDIKHILAELKVTCGSKKSIQALEIVRRGDLIVHSRQKKFFEPDTSIESKDAREARLIKEHAQSIVEVVLELKKESDKELAESVIGPLDKGDELVNYPGCYKVKLTVENLMKVIELDVEGTLTSPPPWDKGAEIDLDKNADLTTKSEKTADSTTNDSQSYLPPPTTN